MAKLPTSTLKTAAPSTDPLRMRGIVAAIRGTLGSFLDTESTKDDAKLALADATEGAVNARESIFGKLATFSREGQWSLGEIKSAALEASKDSENNTVKSIATFMGECKMAMHPTVRSFFDEIVAVRDAAWDAETQELEVAKAAKADAPPAPLRKAFKRKFHVLTTVLREAQEQRYYDTPEALVEFARTKDPSLDAEKIRKRMDSIVAQLQEFHKEFPDSELEVCVGFLNGIKVEHLIAARNDMLGVEVEVAAAATTKSATVVTESEAEPAAGVVDLDALMTTYHGAAGSNAVNLGVAA